MTLPSRLEAEAQDGDVDGTGQKYKTIAELKQEEARKRAGAAVDQLAVASLVKRLMMRRWCGFIGCLSFSPTPASCIQGSQPVICDAQCG